MPHRAARESGARPWVGRRVVWNFRFGANFKETEHRLAASQDLEAIAIEEYPVL